MDFENLHADVNRWLNKHFTAGRGGKRIDRIVIHYNAANLTIDGCYSVWQTRQASAHYQVEEGGRIGQLVHDYDTAWHAGDFDVNQRSIGIEHANRPDGTVSDACLDAGAHLVAALCKNYSLGRPEWGKNVFPHKQYCATSCPGQLYGSQKDAYIRRAQEHYDAMTGGKPAPKPSTPKPQPSKPAQIAVDGFWGPSTTKLAQQIAGLVADGEVWGQYSGNRHRFKGCTGGWKWDNSLKGSPLIRWMQANVLHIAADGIAGKDFANAMIRRYGNGYCDGKLDGPSTAIAGFQRSLNNGRF